VRVCARAIHRMICQCGTPAVAGAYNTGTTLRSGQLSGGVDKVRRLCARVRVCARAIHRMICQCGTPAVAGAYNTGTTLRSGQLSGGVDKVRRLCARVRVCTCNSSYDLSVWYTCGCWGLQHWHNSMLWPAVWGCGQGVVFKHVCDISACNFSETEGTCCVGTYEGRMHHALGNCQSGSVHVIIVSY